MSSRVAGSFSPDKEFYRPQIELDCQLIQWLVKEQEFAADPLTVGDVGVAFGFDRIWDLFADQCLLIGFEPDLEECDLLRREYEVRKSLPLPREKVENIALWETPGTIPFYVTALPNNSSCLPPNKALYDSMPGESQVVLDHTVEISATTLDTYQKESKIKFDFLKLDVQGGELAILKGGVQRVLGSVLAAVVEVGFVERYMGEPYFAGIDQFMREQGFRLFDIDIRRWRRHDLPQTYDGLRVGQTVWADTLYMRDPVSSDGWAPESGFDRSMILKLAALAERYSLPDYAIDIIYFAETLSLINESEKTRFVDLLNSNKIIRTFDRFRRGDDNVPA